MQIWTGFHYIQVQIYARSCILVCVVCVCAREGWLPRLQYLMLFFMLSWSIKPSLIHAEQLFISNLTITLLLMAQPFTFTFFLDQCIHSSSTSQCNGSSSNSKRKCQSLPSVSLFGSYLTNINSDLLPSSVSVFVISTMLKMPVKKQICYKNWTRLCFVFAWLGIATSGSCLLCHWNICCLDV